MRRTLKWLQEKNKEVRILFDGHYFTGYICDVKRKFFFVIISFNGMTARDEIGIFPINKIAVFYDIK